MKVGRNFVIDLDTLKDVNFKEEWTNNSTFPLEVFHHDKWREYDYYKSVVRPKEEADSFTLH